MPKKSDSAAKNNKKPAAKPAAKDVKNDTKKAGALPNDQLKADLIKGAKKAGEITQKEINEVFPETAENADVLDSLYTALADNSIKIVAGEEAGPEMSDEWVADDDEEIVVSEQV